jgi:hypothetical protein
MSRDDSPHNKLLAQDGIEQDGRTSSPFMYVLQMTFTSSTQMLYFQTGIIECWMLAFQKSVIR